MGRTFTLAVVHLEIKLGSKRSNLKRLQSIMTSLFQGRRRGEIDAVLLPQFPLTGPIIGYHNEDRVLAHLRNAAERLQPGRGGSGFTVSTLSRLAGEYGVSFIGGPLVERAGPWLYFTLFYINDRGEIEDKYRKVTLSEAERKHGIGRGSASKVFTLPGGLRIGVFSDNDLVNPELFRSMQIDGANIAVGTLLPARGSPIPIEERDGVLTPRRPFLENLASARSFETGLPLILVGGIVLDSNGGSLLGYSDTIIIDPEHGVIESYVRGVDDPNSHVIVEIDSEASTPRPCDGSCLTAIRILCNKKRRNLKSGE